MMANKKESRYKYTQSESEILRVLKMQENDLVSLENASIHQTGELKKIRSQIERLATEYGVIPVAKPKVGDVSSMSLNIPRRAIPSWEELVERVNSEVRDEVVLEDFLTREEFQYCIKDIEKINNEFSEKTSIWNKRDLSFLAIAVGLQTARWIILQQLFGDLGVENRGERESNSIADARKKKECHDYGDNHKERKGTKSEKGYPTWDNILFGQYKREDGGTTKWKCPYDAQSNGPIGFNDGGNGIHRMNTLGHDPILGWIFGTANIMTCSISLSKRFNFANYHVLYPGARFGEEYSYLEMFNDMFQSIKEDKYRLCAAVFAQGAHLRSDKQTPNGLPIPVLEILSEELVGKLYTEQYDHLCLLKDLKKVGAQAGLAILINMVIGLVHKLFYDEKKDGTDKNLYEVRTRKILLISNLLASGGNVLYCAFSEDWKKLDIGGILVSLYRLVSDSRFMTRIKEQFIQQHLDEVLIKEIAEIDAEFI